MFNVWSLLKFDNYLLFLLSWASNYSLVSQVNHPKLHCQTLEKARIAPTAA
jgi:hypothetical protein